MTAQEVIEIILKDLQISPNEFAGEIGASTSVIHNLVTGVTLKITSGTARKICDRFSQYDYNDLVSLQNPIRKKENKSELLKSVNNQKLTAIEVVEMWEEYKKIGIFKNRLDQEVMKKLLQFKNSPEAEQEWLNSI